MKYIQLALVILLLLCIADLPYGFYVFVRYAAMVGFAYLAWQYYKVKKENLTFTFIALAVLFQPFFKIALGRTLWNMVDVAVAGLLIILMLNKIK